MHKKKRKATSMKFSFMMPRAGATDMSYHSGHLLRFQCQFRCEETMLLRHGRSCPVQDIIYEEPAERKFHIVAIDMYRLPVVRHIKMIPPVIPGNVNVLSDLDETLRSEDGQPSVAPGLQ